MRTLIDALNRAGIRYCHWKSNRNLAMALRGETDLDLLVHRSDAARFQSIIGSLGFKPTVGDPGSAICHYYGLDRRSGILVHLHVYCRIQTGGSVLKNHRLPVEGMLLSGIGQVDGVFVPDRAAELVLFVIRKMLEYAEPIEALYLAREGTAVARELEWLADGVSDDDIARLLREHFPTLDLEFFQRCRAAIGSRSTVRRLRLGRMLAFRLRHLRRYSRPRATLIRTTRLWGRVWRRLMGRGPAEPLLSGGAVIAVVGADGVGKSTVVGELRRWLESCLPVAAIHSGKPPATALTLAPRLLLPLLRKTMPRYRATAVETDDGERRERGPEGLRRGRLFLVYPLRAVMLAFERKHLLARAHRRAAGGALVLSDRYPTLEPGVPEGPALAFLLDDPNPLYRWLARMEQRIYRTIAPPELLIYLDVPVDVACHRNLTRDKPGELKPTTYVRHRHAQSAKLQFPGLPVRRVSTAADLEETMRSVKTIVWNGL